MGSQEDFKLQWSEFEANLQSTYTRLRTTGHFSDVTLVCEDGQHVKAHRTVLAATSPVFEAILSLEDHPKPLIYMRGVKRAQLNALMDFIYLGHVEVTSEHLNDFFSLSEELKIKGLTRNVKVENVETEIEEKNVEQHLDLSGEKESEADKGSVEVAEMNVEMRESFNSSGGADGTLEFTMEGNLTGEATSAQFPCNMCDKVSVTAKGLEKHKYRNHSVKKDRPEHNLEAPAFHCSLCGKGSTTKGGLQKHFVRYHKDDLPIN